MVGKQWKLWTHKPVQQVCMCTKSAKNLPIRKAYSYIDTPYLDLSAASTLLQPPSMRLLYSLLSYIHIFTHASTHLTY